VSTIARSWRGRWSRTRLAGWWIVPSLAGCALLGYLASRGDGLDALLGFLAIIVIYLMSKCGKAVLAGVVLVAALSGIPLVNMQSLRVRGSFQALDVCAVALIAIGTYGLFQNSRRIPVVWSRLLAVSSLGLLLAWAQAVIHAVDSRAPVLSAALYGRDFLFFAILLPVSPYILSNRRDVFRFAITVAFLTTIFSAGLIAASLHLIPKSVVNAYLAHHDGSLIRIYTRMQELIALGMACSMAYLLLGARRHRLWVTASLILCTGAVVVLLTRALYIGLIAGIVACFATWGLGYSGPSARVRRRLALFVGGILLVVVALVVLDPAVVNSSALQAIITRFSAGVENLQGQGSGSLQLREHLASFELNLLGGHWLFGLGFLPPSVFYIPQLPSGSVRDVDLGALQSVMTMGAVGTVFVYLPIVVATIKLARPLRAGARRLEWIRLGVYIWLVSVLASSITLDTLFGETGSLLTAVVLGAVIRVTALETADVAATALAPNAAQVESAYARQAGSVSHGISIPTS